MTMVMTTNQQVQFYLTCSDKRASKHKKILRMQQLEKDLEQRHLFLDELFQRKTIRVLDEIVYLTTICGVIKIGADRLAINSKVSVRTVYNAIRAIKENSVGFYVGYLKGSHKYVFIDLSHTDAKQMLADLFTLSELEIKAIFAVHFAVCSSAKNSSISIEKDDISFSNSLTKNKILINKKTFTKDSNSSASKDNLYYRLKTLVQARKGALSNFRALVGIIYSKMKKLKVDASIGLTHAQLESIMYQSLDALLNMSNVKNELAMLNSIIKNKINDAIKPTIKPLYATNGRTEYIPDWFASWNDVSNTSNHSNNNSVVNDETSTVDFEAERAKILAKLDY